MSDYDPRIVDLYDLDNPNGADHDFYRQLATDMDATNILDIGCGTGILTVTFVQDGRHVTGIDPSAAMLDYARKRPGADRVEWIHGTSADIPDGPFDLAVMTGNVAQHIVDPHWEATLRDIHQALRPGGTIAFETRNPLVRAWEDWAAEPRETRETIHGPLTEWIEIDAQPGGVIHMRSHNVFEATGEHVVEQQTLMFRSRELIEEQLSDAGFALHAIYSDWAKAPWQPDARLIVVEARA